MNVFFHVTTAVGIIVAVSETSKIDKLKDTVVPAFGAFLIGVISHGILDYLPHTYPFSGKVDVFLSLTMILLLFFLSRKRYLPILATSFLGCLLPDLIDLLPSILNKLLNLGLSDCNKIFPFHNSAYSGSIFSGTSIISDINHISVILITCFLILCRKSDFSRIFIKKDDKL